MTLLDALAPAGSIQAAAAPPGADRTARTRPIAGGWPVLGQPPGALTMGTARLLLLITGIAWLAYLYEQIGRIRNADLTMQTAIEAGVYFILVGLLTASSAAYLLARTGYFERIKAHRRAARSTMDDFFSEKSPSLTVLVPSYREEPRVVQQTLLSAALQEYPGLRVVLLIDDPAEARTSEQRRNLESCRALPELIATSMREPHRQFEAALKAFESEVTTDAYASIQTLWDLAGEYDEAVRWFETTKHSLPHIDHTDEFLVIEVLDRLATDLHLTAEAMREAAAEPHPSVPRRRAHQLYRRLERIFNVEIVSFERKQFASLSHEPNKAMNLNSYIGLMGGDYRIMRSREGRFLVSADGQPADLCIPDSDYILTLDADSMLLPEYCQRLVYLMEQKENADVAVAQTPYSAYRGAKSHLERVAGATTDIQHIVHQGLTRYNATFWVGANAVIRKAALMDIEERYEEDGASIHRYIKDRTVIEDTESSIDLRARGWRLINYPERLSYSATPADFGSLIIQRQRWSNGGLVILPALLSLLGKRREGVARLTLPELFLRTNYLTSISWACLSLSLLLLYPFDSQLLSRYALLTALPYFLAMANDLHRQGYRRRDIIAVYGFNLLLLPVNILGTLQSLAQTVTGHKPAFARTPKVMDRTVAPFGFVLIPLLLIGWSARSLLQDVGDHTYYHGIFAATNLVVMGYATVALLGLRGIVFDLGAGIRHFVQSSSPVSVAAPAASDWKTILYVGGSLPEEIEHNGALGAALAARDQFDAEAIASFNQPVVPAKTRRARTRVA